MGDSIHPASGQIEKMVAEFEEVGKTLQDKSIQLNEMKIQLESLPEKALNQDYTDSLQSDISRLTGSITENHNKFNALQTQAQSLPREAIDQLSQTPVVKSAIAAAEQAAASTTQLIDTAKQTFTDYTGLDFDGTFTGPGDFNIQSVGNYEWLNVGCLFGFPDVHQR